MGETMDGSRILKILTGSICCLALVAISVPQQADAKSKAHTGQATKKAKGCKSAKKSSRAKKRCRREDKPRLTWSAASAAALSEGQRRAGRPVSISRGVRLSRTSFSVDVTWVKRPPIGTQDCSLSIGVQGSSRLVVTSEENPRCGQIQEDKDFKDRFQSGPGPKFCPSDQENSWNAKTDLEGKTFQEGVAIAAEYGCEVRIVRQDGVDLAVTMDFRFNRLNVEVEGPEQRIIRVDSVA